MNVTVQLPAERVQLGALREPVPVDENATVPVAVIVDPILEVSVTIAVQVEAWMVVTGVAQETERALVRLPALTVAGLEVELPVCARSPAKTALMFAAPLAVGVKVTLQEAEAVFPNR